MDNIKDRFNKLKSKKEILLEEKEFKGLKLKSKKKKYDDLVKARWVLAEVVELTQAKFKNKVEKLITMVLQSVFQKKMKFILELEKKNNRLNAIPWIEEEGGYRYNPKTSKGGSLKELIAFAFRIVLWSMENPRSRNTFVLDEPFTAIGKGPMLEKVGKMLKELSDKLKLQFIIVSHEKEMAKIADNTIRINQKNKESFIEE